MSESLETWWAINYRKYSLKDLNALPVYHRFLAAVYPFQLVTGSVSEGFKSNDEVDTLYWQDESVKKSERFSHNRKEKEFSYELIYQEANCTVKVASHIRDSQEWGEIIKQFESWELQETWKYAPPAKEFSRFTLENGVRKGFKTGLTLDGEHWVEETWSQPSESSYRKTYDRPGANGGESINKKDSHTWGEQWHTSSEVYEVKTWEEEPGRRWGRSSGRVSRGKHWEHEYEFREDGKREERIVHAFGTISGYRFRQHGQSWHKEEWVGSEVLKSGATDHELLTSDLRLEVDQLYLEALRNAKISYQGLGLMQEEYPAFISQAKELESILDTWNGIGKLEISEVVRRLGEVQDLTRKVETLKRNLWESVNAQKKVSIQEERRKLERNEDIEISEGLEPWKDTINSEFSPVFRRTEVKESIAEPETVADLESEVGPRNPEIQLGFGRKEVGQVSAEPGVATLQLKEGPRNPEIQLGFGRKEVGQVSAEPGAASLQPKEGPRNPEVQLGFGRKEVGQVSAEPGAASLQPKEGPRNPEVQLGFGRKEVGQVSAEPGAASLQPKEGPRNPEVQLGFGRKEVGQVSAEPGAASLQPKEGPRNPEVQLGFGRKEVGQVSAEPGAASLQPKEGPRNPEVQLGFGRKEVGQVSAEPGAASLQPKEGPRNPEVQLGFGRKEVGQVSAEPGAASLQPKEGPRNPEVQLGFGRKEVGQVSAEPGAASLQPKERPRNPEIQLGFGRKEVGQVSAEPGAATLQPKEGPRNPEIQLGFGRKEVGQVSAEPGAATLQPKEGPRNPEVQLGFGRKEVGQVSAEPGAATLQPKEGPRNPEVQLGFGRKEVGQVSAEPGAATLQPKEGPRNPEVQLGFGRKEVGQVSAEPGAATLQPKEGPRNPEVQLGFGRKEVGQVSAEPGAATLQPKEGPRNPEVQLGFGRKEVGQVSAEPGAATLQPKEGPRNPEIQLGFGRKEVGQVSAEPGAATLQPKEGPRNPEVQLGFGRKEVGQVSAEPGAATLQPKEGPRNPEIQLGFGRKEVGQVSAEPGAASLQPKEGPRNPEIQLGFGRKDAGQVSAEPRATATLQPIERARHPEISLSFATKEVGQITADSRSAAGLPPKAETRNAEISLSFATKEVGQITADSRSAAGLPPKAETRNAEISLSFATKEVGQIIADPRSAAGLQPKAVSQFKESERGLLWEEAKHEDISPIFSRKESKEISEEPGFAADLQLNAENQLRERERELLKKINALEAENRAFKSPGSRISVVLSPPTDESDLQTLNEDLASQVSALKAELAVLRPSPKLDFPVSNPEDSASDLDSSFSEEIIIQKATDKDFEAAERMLRLERQDTVNNNPILQSMKQEKQGNEKLLTNFNLFKFCEELMDKKLEVDNADLLAHRRPRTMTEFLMEHLNRQFGIKSLAMKFLGQFMPSLFNLVQDGHKYAVLFARILQVFHPDPVPLQLALVLARVRPDFQVLIDKCSKEREARDSKRGLKKSERSPQKSQLQIQMDLMSSGGVAFVSDVMLRLYDFFDNDQESGELALELLRPVQVSKVDFLLFKICHKMAALGLSARDVFAMIDSDGGGTIDEDEFVEGIRSSLDLMISTPEIIEVFQAIASGQELTKDKFLARCNFDWYHSVVKSDDYTISKCDYLTLMTSVYEVRDKRDIAELVALYESQGEDPMSPETFKRIIWSLNAKTSKKRIERIWNIGLSLSETKAGLPMDIFVKVMLRYRTGTFAATKFCKAYSDTPEIETAVEDRKTSALDTKQSSESSLLIGDQEVPAIAKKLGTAMLQKTTGTGKSGGKNK